MLRKSCVGDRTEDGDTARAAGVRRDCGPSAEVAILVGRQHGGSSRNKSVHPACRHCSRAKTQTWHRAGRLRASNDSYVVVNVAVFVVPHARRLMEARRHDLRACSRFVIGVRGSRSEDQVSPRLGIRQQPIEVRVAGDVKAGYYETGMLYRRTLRRAVGREQMLGVNDARLQLGIKGTAVEGVEKTLVGTSVGRAVVGCKGWLRPERPPAASRVDEAHVRVRNQAGDRVTSALELAAELCDLAIHPSGPAAVGKNTAPVRLSPKVQGVPMPVLDHFGAAGYESPRCLPPLAVVGRPVVRRAGDGLSI